MRPGTKILSRDKKIVGLATGASRPCPLEGCTGRRITVKWPRKARFSRSGITCPCTKGMEILPDGTWHIL
jgi:hypothetical protein